MSPVVLAWVCKKKRLQLVDVSVTAVRRLRQSVLRLFAKPITNMGGNAMHSRNSKVACNLLLHGTWSFECDLWTFLPFHARTKVTVTRVFFFFNSSQRNYWNWSAARLPCKQSFWQPFLASCDVIAFAARMYINNAPPSFLSISVTSRLRLVKSIGTSNRVPGRVCRKEGGSGSVRRGEVDKVEQSHGSLAGFACSREYIGQLKTAARRGVF